MRAELCGCALHAETAKKVLRAAEKTRILLLARRRARGQDRSVNNETYGDVLVKGEERGRGTRCVRTATLPAATRARGGPTTPALLVVKDTPRRIYFTKMT